MSWNIDDDLPIDATRDMALIAKISLHVRENSHVFNSDNARRDLSIFSGYESNKVFMHYVTLIDAAFIEGGYDIQTETVTARFLTGQVKTFRKKWQVAALASSQLRLRSTLTELYFACSTPDKGLNAEDPTQ